MTDWSVIYKARGRSAADTNSPYLGYTLQNELYAVRKCLNVLCLWRNWLEFRLKVRSGQTKRNKRLK